MISKIATIGLVGLLGAALIGGSAYILLRPDAATVARGAASSYNGNNNAGGQQGNSYQGGRGAQDQLAARGEGNGYQGGSDASQGRQAGSGTPGEGVADHPIESWETLSGRVLTVEDDELTIQTGEGLVTLHLGPEWYWEVEGIALAEGDQAEASGFYEDDRFELARIKNNTSGQEVLLRDETGRPLWASRGRGGRASRA
jgi:hypothetical protein